MKRQSRLSENSEPITVIFSFDLDLVEDFAEVRSNSMYGYRLNVESHHRVTRGPLPIWITLPAV